MTILVECTNCFFVFRENTEKPIDNCPECGWMELIEVKSDWNKKP